ncbi:MAG: PEP-CTERM sorting domain-containing protein [Pseudomonadota bacterium]
MSILRAVAIVVFFGVILAGSARADLIQEITVTNYTGDGEVLETTGQGANGPNFHFGTLIFPNELQRPFGGQQDCSYGPHPNLPPCEFAQFLPDFDAFGPFSDIDGEGVGATLPESLDVRGTWTIGDDWMVQGIFAWIWYDLSEIGSNGVLTLVFGSGNNICGTIQDQQIRPGDCFGPSIEEKEIFSYRLDPAHAVPEPGALGLFGLGLMGMVLIRRRRT